MLRRIAELVEVSEGPACAGLALNYPAFTSLGHNLFEHRNPPAPAILGAGFQPRNVRYENIPPLWSKHAGKNPHFNSVGCPARPASGGLLRAPSRSPPSPGSRGSETGRAAAVRLPGPKGGRSGCLRSRLGDKPGADGGGNPPFFRPAAGPPVRRGDPGRQVVGPVGKEDRPESGSGSLRHDGVAVGTGEMHPFYPAFKAEIHTPIDERFHWWFYPGMAHHPPGRDRV